MRRARIHWMAASLVVACGGADLEDVDSSTSGASSGHATDESSSSSDDESTGGEETGPAPVQAVPAHGIVVDRVDVNQGIGLDVVVGGETIVPQAPIVENRRALLRARWAVDASWQPRQIEARLTLTQADGSELVRSSVVTIDGPWPDDDPLAPAFEWILEPQDVRPDATYFIELWEVDSEAVSADAPGEPPRLPGEGTAPLPVAPGPFNLDLVLVPVEYDTNFCQTQVDTSEATLGYMLEEVLARLPVATIAATVHTPLVVTDQATAPEEILQRITGLRAAENPAPNVIYMGLVDACDGLPVGGQAWAPPIPPTPGDAGMRAGWALIYSNMVDATAAGLTHELTHALGRQHVACTGEEGQLDPNAPTNDAALEAPGWGVHDLGWRDPELYADYMSYCYPGWVSRYGWEMVLPIVETLSSWDLGDRVDSNARRVLLGARGPTGEVEQWTRVHATVDARERTTTESATIVGSSGARWTAEVYVRPLPDSDLEAVMVYLPADTPPRFELIHERAARRRTYEIAPAGTE